MDLSKQFTKFDYKKNWWIIVLAVIGIILILKGQGFLGALIPSGTYAKETIIDSADSLDGWLTFTAATTAPTLDTVNFQEGTGSINLGKLSDTSLNGAGYIKGITPFDGTGKEIYVWVYITDINQLNDPQGVSIAIGSGGVPADLSSGNAITDHFGKNYPKSELSNGWNLLGGMISDFTFNTGNPDITNLNKIQITIYTPLSSDIIALGDIKMDKWYTVEMFEGVNPSTTARSMMVYNYEGTLPEYLPQDTLEFIEPVWNGNWEQIKWGNKGSAYLFGGLDQNTPEAQTFLKNIINLGCSMSDDELLAALSVNVDSGYQYSIKYMCDRRYIYATSYDSAKPLQEVWGWCNAYSEAIAVDNIDLAYAALVLHAFDRTPPASEGCIIKGDVTGDGVVTIIDLSLARDMASLKIPSNLCADINDDGVVTSIDVVAIKDMVSLRSYVCTGSIYQSDIIPTILDGEYCVYNTECMSGSCIDNLCAPIVTETTAPSAGGGGGGGGGGSSGPECTPGNVYKQDEHKCVPEPLINVGSISPTEEKTPYSWLWLLILLLAIVYYYREDILKYAKQVTK